jgi:Tol biopolymer transport system component
MPDSAQETGKIVYFTSTPAAQYMVIESDGSGSSQLSLSAVISSTIPHSFSNLFGRRAEYLAFYSTTNDFRIIDLNSLDESFLYNTGANTADSISVSPDQKYIAFSTTAATSDYYIMSIDNPSSPLYIAYSNDPTVSMDKISWSPDSEYVTFVTDTSGFDELRTCRKNGSDLLQLTNFADGLTTPSNPKWSPKGDRILFFVTLGGSSYINSVKTDGTDMYTHAENASPFSKAVWSPNGDRIAFCLNTQLYVVDSDGSSSPKLLNGSMMADNVSWSAFGTKLLVTFYNGTDNDIYYVDPDSGDYYMLADGTGNQMYPLWLID